MLDYWGEGLIKTSDNVVTGFVDAYNVNHQYQLVSNGPDKGRKVPNRVPVDGYATPDTGAYIAPRSCQVVTIMGSPIIAATAADILRVVNPSGTVIAFGYQVSDSQLTTLYRSLGNAFIYSPTFVPAGEFAGITLTPAVAFLSVATVQAQFTFALSEEDYAIAAAILWSMYNDFGGLGRQNLQSFVDSVSPGQLFPLCCAFPNASAGLTFIAQYVKNADLVNLIRAGLTNTTIQLACDAGGDSFLNGLGNSWSGGPGYFVTIDPGTVGGADAYEWNVSPLNSGVQLTANGLVMKGDLWLWSGGPDYQVVADPSLSCSFTVIPDGGGQGIRFQLFTNNGEKYLYGPGILWSGGPSYFATMQDTSSLWTVVASGNV